MIATNCWRALCIAIFACGWLSAEITSFESADLSRVPAAYKGRFRPLESYARLWLYDFYHHETIKPAHRDLFHSTDGSALDLLWKMHFLGHAPWDEAPLFWIQDDALKHRLGLDAEINHFSYHQLQHAIYANRDSNLSFLKPLLINHFIMKYQDPANRSLSEKLELTALSPGLWVTLRGDDLVVASTPRHPPWHYLEPGMVLLQRIERQTLSENRIQKNADQTSLTLLANLNQYAQIGNSGDHDEQTLLKTLPSKQGRGEWLPLKALTTKPIGNFTLYPDGLFEEIRSIFIALESAFQNSASNEESLALSRQLAQRLNQGYALIEGTPYLEAAEKSMNYASSKQLLAEVWYYRIPFAAITMCAYGFAIAFLWLAGIYAARIWNIAGIICLFAAFCSHTTLLGLRSYILERPPVSNMYETVVYVPWIAMLVGTTLYIFLKNRIILIASALVSFTLLAVLQITNLNSGLENVQAVLDSQYWLVIHVLLVVGSYGAFVLAGVIGHFYLTALAVKQQETPLLKFLAKCILHVMYIGVGMLIPGTILGGVWAAESWGRFWDWDPKESWAFISICIYLIWIHAYTFKQIKNFGLAVGSICGLIAISFTWYGVNYVLGAGLHSYGFGSGGELYYYGFLLSEMLFLLIVWKKTKYCRAIS